VDGKVAIWPKEDSAFDPVATLKAVYDSGVSVAQMTVTATGELQRDPVKGLVFQINNRVSFEVKPNELSEKLKDQAGSGKPLSIRGAVYRKPPGKTKRRLPASFPLEILEVLH
jgi:hypothetical protein